MARIVELKDQTPLLVKAKDLTNGVCAVCRCGLSGKWPYCDGTHKATIGEEPGKVYRYERDLPQGVPRRTEVGEARMPEREAPPREPGHKGVHRPGRPVPGEDVHGGAAAPEEPTETVGGQGPAGP